MSLSSWCLVLCPSYLRLLVCYYNISRHYYNIYYNIDLIRQYSKAWNIQDFISVGLTRFDLLGHYRTVEWLKNVKVILIYNVTFVVLSVLCLVKKVTTAVLLEVMVDYYYYSKIYQSKSLFPLVYYFIPIPGLQTAAATGSHPTQVLPPPHSPVFLCGDRPATPPITPSPSQGHDAKCKLITYFIDIRLSSCQGSHPEKQTQIKHYEGRLPASKSNNLDDMIYITIKNKMNRLDFLNYFISKRIKIFFNF